MVAAVAVNNLGFFLLLYKNIQEVDDLFGCRFICLSPEKVTASVTGWWVFES
jgi:hypothetical protein